MASIHVRDLQKILFERGELDAYPPPVGQGGFFLEIRFDDDTHNPVIDDEYRNKVITTDCYLGTVTIQWDSNGELRSLDIS